MKEYFQNTKIFTILFALAYILGLCAGFYNKEILFSFLFTFLFILAILFLNFPLKKIVVLYFLFLFGIAKANISIELPCVIDEIISDNAEISGQIVSVKSINKNDKIKFYLRADGANIDNKKYENLNTKILVSLDFSKEEDEKILIGNYVKLFGKLRNPISVSNPYQFDYEKYLLNNDVKNILYANKIEVSKNLSFSKNLRDNWYFILKKFELTRNKIVEVHSKNIKSPNLEILGGIVFGNETVNPDENIKENFKNSGLLHLLAASGLNVALIYGIWWWLANLIRFSYNLSICLGAVFVVFYTFMTGFPPSILRAGAMLLFVLFGKIIDRNANSLALIFFVAFLMLLFSPKMLFDVGFQLSFVVTIALVVCMNVIVEKFKKADEKYKEKYKNASRFKKYILYLFSPLNIATIVSIPFVAQLFVIPLQMHYFNNFTPFSIFANILVVPFIGILSFIGFLSSIFALVPILNEHIVYLFDMFANPLLTLLVKISEFFSSFKMSSITTFGFSVFQIFFFWICALLFVLNLKFNFKNKKQILILAVFVLIFLFSFIKFDCFNKNLEIVMFDVGNADSFLIKTPNKNYIMIDTGKKSYKGWSSYEGIIKKYLKNERIKNLEKLIITHFDSDHCADADKIFELINVKEVIIPNLAWETKTADEIIAYIKESKQNYKIAKNDDEIYSENDLKIKTFITNLENKNESSIITYLSYKNKSILLMGDCGIVAYKEIKEKLPCDIDIIKVGHHGAKNSLNQEMLEKFNPKYALISSASNDFNHPHSSIMNLLLENDINILPSMWYGFMKITINDDGFKFKYFDKDKKKLQNLNLINKTNLEFHESEYFKDFIKKHSNN